jgi:hypothetical protein
MEFKLESKEIQDFQEMIGIDREKIILKQKSN